MKKMNNLKSRFESLQIILSETNDHSDSYYTDYYKSRTINHDSDEELYSSKHLHTYSVSLKTNNLPNVFINTWLIQLLPSLPFPIPSLLLLHHSYQ